MRRGFVHLLAILIILGLIVVVGLVFFASGGLQKNIKNVITGRKSLPLVAFPKPFESGYFTALDSPEVVATVGDLEITTDPRSYTFSMPYDGHVARTALIKNVGNGELYVEFRAEITVPSFDETM